MSANICGSCVPDDTYASSMSIQKCSNNLVCLKDIWGQLSIMISKDDQHTYSIKLNFVTCINLSAVLYAKLWPSLVRTPDSSPLPLPQNRIDTNIIHYTDKQKDKQTARPSSSSGQSWPLWVRSGKSVSVSDVVGDLWLSTSVCKTVNTS